MSCILLASSAMAQPDRQRLTADSLFQAGKYTESFDIYDQLLEGGNYSSSMLLKLAYIKEGLGDISGALYYLNLYYKETSNKLVLTKLEQMAKDHQLVGYEYSDTEFFMSLLRRFHYQIVGVLMSVSLLLLALTYVRKKRSGKAPLALGIAHLVTLFLLFYLINLGEGTNQGIIIDQSSYLMTGPSSGSDVVEIINKGHKVKILGKEGIWLKIEWQGDEVFIRENKIRSLG